MSDITTRLPASPEPAVRLKLLLGALDRDSQSPEVARARQAVRKSDRVAALLSERTSDGRIPFPGQVVRRPLGACDTGGARLPTG
jgi:hypothetical protein